MKAAYANLGAINMGPRCRLNPAGAFPLARLRPSAPSFSSDIFNAIEASETLRHLVTSAEHIRRTLADTLSLSADTEIFSIGVRYRIYSLGNGRDG